MGCQLASFLKMRQVGVEGARFMLITNRLAPDVVQPLSDPSHWPLMAPLCSPLLWLLGLQVALKICWLSPLPAVSNSVLRVPFPLRQHRRLESHDKKMPRNDDHTFFLYSDGCSPQDLALGHLVFGSYATPNHGHYCRMPKPLG